MHCLARARAPRRSRMQSNLRAARQEFPEMIYACARRLRSLRVTSTVMSDHLRISLQTPENLHALTETHARFRSEPRRRANGTIRAMRRWLTPNIIYYFRNRFDKAGTKSESHITYSAHFFAHSLHARRPFFFFAFGCAKND